MASKHSADIFLLLADYSERLRQRLSAARTAKLPPSNRPLWLRAEDLPQRTQWLARHGPGSTDIGPSQTSPPAFLAERFDPFRRLREAPGPLSWPPDESTPLSLGTDWAAHRFHARTAAARGVSLAAHAVGLALLLVPSILQLDTEERPSDWNSMRITLSTPPLDDLPPLRGRSEIEGPGEGGFRGLQQPVPEPEPAAEPEPVPVPEQPKPEEPAAEVPQPIETPEAEEPEEEPALAETEPPEEAELPAAQSPVPGEFRSGREFAQNRDPRLLPMPAAPKRTRAALQLEDPKAMMPGRRGPAQLGTMELNARPDQVIEGAIQDLIRGGGGRRQAVGDGIGGYPSASAPPSGPSNSGSAVELLSDPRGVDFRPYLTQILAAVRRNWFAVIPESARLGMTRGRTLIQFSVARNGSVPKLVIARTSGTPPLDRAAVAGISASNPFPPLPSEYLGQDIRLQFTFLYNIQNP